MQGAVCLRKAPSRALLLKKGAAEKCAKGTGGIHASEHGCKLLQSAKKLLYFLTVHFQNFKAHNFLLG